MDSNFQPQAPINTGSATPFAPMPSSQPAQAPSQGQNVQGFITAARAKNVPDSQIYSYLQQKGYLTPPKPASGGAFGGKPTSSFGGTPSNTPDNPVADYANNVKDTFVGGVNKTISAVNQSAQEGGSFGADRALQPFEAGTGLLQAATSPLAPIYKPLGDIIHAAGTKLADAPLLQAYGKDTASLPANELTAPEKITEGIQDASQLAMAGLGGPETLESIKNIPSQIKSGVDTIKSSISPTKENIPNVKQDVTANAQPNQATNNSIVDNYNKAIKPSVGSKNNAKDLKSANANVVSGVNSIIANKEGLSFTGKNGEEITGQTPSTVMDMSNAIAQTKRSLFTQYDALAKQAGETGAQISTEPIAGELDKVINNQALQVTHPEAVSYAKGLQSRLQNSDGTYKAFDPETTQEMIKNYNNSLEAFYKNPSFDAASKAAINAGIVNNLRQALDSTIEKITTGKDSANAGAYQQLKSQYGALTALEKDVAKRANVIARQTGHGLADYADIFSGSDMVHGILSANPALFAKGVAQAGLTKYFSYLKSPDRAIQNMFNVAQGKGSYSDLMPKALGGKKN